MDRSSQYNRYRMTYPFEGPKIYKSKHLKKVVKKCYSDYKKMNDMSEGLFCVTNLDNNIEYKFGVKNGVIKKHKQRGGADDISDTTKNILDTREEEKPPTYEESQSDKKQQPTMTLRMGLTQERILMILRPAAAVVICTGLYPRPRSCWSWVPSPP